MKFRLLVILFFALAFIRSAHAQTSFTRGHIFVGMTELESCDFGGREWIVEIDPETGQNWIFADSDDGICVLSGLRFTPDGTQLLAANAGHLSPTADYGWIQAFNPDGSSEIILDGDDGLSRPLGSNALAFDAAGDLYVGSGENGYILRYSGIGSPPTIFADWMDGVDIRGGLDFAPSGNLYYARWSGAVLRFSPDGQVFQFDDIGPRSVAVDRFGNVFTPGNLTVNRFDCENPLAERLLASGLSGVPFSLALSPDSSVLYVATRRVLYALDPEVGNPTVLSDYSHISPFSLRAVGVAVHAPSVPGDMDGDGVLNLQDVAFFQNCRGGVIDLESCGCVPADLNRDTVVDLLDWQQLALYFIERINRGEDYSKSTLNLRPHPACRHLTHHIALPSP